VSIWQALAFYVSIGMGRYAYHRRADKSMMKEDFDWQIWPKRSQAETAEIKE
jgi:hypothetical protein